jgi:hypothetical protein
MVTSCGQMVTISGLDTALASKLERKRPAETYCLTGPRRSEPKRASKRFVPAMMLAARYHQQAVRWGERDLRRAEGLLEN